ncbi:hypothetical protein PQX77_005610 [Marasmius sp. AFHP31]|nr:hypothetical protein PQX77_005610 [Marasmius sp. AFHP31]
MEDYEMEDLTICTNDFVDEPTMIPFTRATAQEFLHRLGLNTDSLGTPSDSMNEIVSRLEKLARPRSPVPESSSPPLATSSPTLPSLPSSPVLSLLPISLPPSSPPQSSSPPSLSPLKPAELISLPPLPTTPPPRHPLYNALFSLSPLSPVPETPPSRSTLTLPSPTALRSSRHSLVPATTSLAILSNAPNPPLNSSISVPRRVRLRDAYDSDTASEREVNVVTAALNDAHGDWDYDPEVDSWIITQLEPSESGSELGSGSEIPQLLLSSLQQSDVARLRGGVWTPECRRNSAPLDRENSTSVSAANRAVNADSSALGGGDTWGEHPEGPEDSNHRTEKENPPLPNVWVVDKGKKVKLHPKSSVTAVVMYDLYNKCVTVERDSSWVDYMVDSFDRDNIETLSSVCTSTLGSVGSLADAAETVCRGDAKEQSLGFMNMLSMINFRIRVERIKQETRGTQMDIYKDHLEHTDIGRRVAYTTFSKWIHQGTTFAELVSAGTVYLLFLLAAARLRGRFGPLMMKDTLVVCRAFLRPDEDPEFGKLVKLVYIPAISMLRRRLAIAIPSALPKESRSILGVPDSDVIDLTNLQQARAYCSCLSHNGWKLPERDEKAWATYQLSQSETPPKTILINGHSVVHLYTPPGGQTPQLEQSIVPVNVVQVNTQFDPADEHNKFPCGRDMDSRMAWTLGRRTLLPAACIRPTSVEEFIQEIKDGVEQGYRMDPDSYLYYDQDQLGDRLLDIRDKHNEPIVLLGCTVPSELMVGLLDYIHSLFPELCQTDSSVDGHKKFKCSHLNLYNRYSTKGHDAPHDADPWTLQKEGKRPPDISQFTPRFSAEFYDQEIRGTRLLKAMTPLLKYLATMVKERFPKENGELVAFISGLPLNAASPVHPFGGVAVNVNAATIVHLDPKDLNLCLVLAIHDCTGGELVLEGPGIVIRLKSGDFTIFPSKRISHYNLDFKGLRVSFAFSTDDAAKQWIEDNNGWLDNDYMKSSRT